MRRRRGPAAADRIGGRERIVRRGELPGPSALSSGCAVRSRCPKAEDRCAAERPVLREHAPGQQVACHHPEEAR